MNERRALAHRTGLSDAETSNAAVILRPLPLEAAAR